MALCPLAIASTADQTNGTGSYYFALNGGGAGPVVDSAFLATGTGSPPNNGTFTARAEDTTGAGLDAFVMTDISGVLRWAIGTSGVEAGANSGDNFAVFAYGDGGEFLSAPLTINRASGGVTMSNGLIVGNALIGPDGPVLAQQTDFAVQASLALPAVLPAGKTQYNLGAVFQLPRTGMYVLDGALSFNAALAADTFVCAAGDFIQIQIQPQPAAPGILSGGVAFDVSPVPASASATDRVWNNSTTEKLTGEYNYQAIAIVNNFSGTMAATGSGTLTVSFDAVALC